MASRFVMKDEVPTETFDWGSAGMRGAPPSTGCETYIVMDVELAPGWSVTSMTHMERDPVNSGRLTHPASPQSNWSRTMSRCVMNWLLMLSPGSQWT